MKITKSKTKYLVLVTCLILGGVGGSQVQAKDLDSKSPKTEQIAKQADKSSNDTYKVNFVTNSDDKIKDVNVPSGSTLDLPLLSTKDKVVSGWYTNKDLSEPFNATDKIYENETLYAKWVNFSDYVTKGTSNLIYDKAISEKVKQFLNDNRTLGVTNKIKEEAPKTDDNSLIQSTNYVFNNQDINKSYLLTFLNDSGEFVFSMVQPYNKDIKILNTDGSLFKEYFVRQDTSITLPHVDNQDSNSQVVFKAKGLEKNSQNQVQIFSQLEAKTQQKGAVLPQDLTTKNKDNSSKKQKNKAMLLVSILVAIIGVGCLGFVLYRRKTQKYRENEEFNNEDEFEENLDDESDVYSEEDSEELLEYENEPENMVEEDPENEFEWNKNQAESIDDDLVTLENQVQKAKIKRKKQLEKELKEIQDKLK